MRSQSLKEINIQLYHKLPKGFVDAQLSNKTLDLQRIKEHLPDRYRLVKTGKSHSIRVRVPKLDLQGSFEEHREGVVTAIREALGLRGWVLDNRLLFE